MPAPELTTTPPGPSGTCTQPTEAPPPALGLERSTGSDNGAGDAPGRTEPHSETCRALSLLRLPGQPRFTAEPGIANHLASRLVTTLGPASAAPAPPNGDTTPARGPAVPPVTTDRPTRLVLTRSAVNQALACPAHLAMQRASGIDGQDNLPFARAVLVRALFRQVVTLGSIDDPFADALDAIEADPGIAGLASRVRGLPRDQRDELEHQVTRHARQLASQWSRPPANWLPRTALRFHATMEAANLELVGAADLAIGVPSPDRASVALVLLRTGDQSRSHALDRHLAALAHTLSQGMPPFAVATFYSATGALAVDAVDLAMLEHAASQCTAAARRMIGADASRWSDTSDIASPEASSCPWCGDVPATGSDAAEALEAVSSGQQGTNRGEPRHRSDALRAAGRAHRAGACRRHYRR